MMEDDQSQFSEPPTPGQRIVDNTKGGEVTLAAPKQNAAQQKEKKKCC